MDAIHLAVLRSASDDGQCKKAERVTYDIVETLSDCWLSTSQAYFADSTLDEKSSKTDDFVVCENVPSGRELDALTGHAVEA